MVKGKIAKALCLALGVMLALSGFSAGAESPQAVLHPPRIPPDGQTYDMWQGIVYSGDTSFSVTVPWYLRTSPKNEKKIEEMHYVREPDRPEGTFEILSVRAEPVGGEMRLRSGGYVDVELRASFSVRFRYSYDSERQEETEKDDPWRSVFNVYGDVATGIRFSAPVLYPFDSCTGTTLLNFIKDPDADAISVMEATDSGLVESRVAWDGRLFRLFARQDERNVGGDFEREKQDGRTAVTVWGRTEIVYTFRIPADYDGLALALPRSIPGRSGQLIAGDETGTRVTDVYAEILMGDDGVPLEAENFVFVRLSDLLERFAKETPGE